MWSTIFVITKLGILFTLLVCIIRGIITKQKTGIKLAIISALLWIAMLIPTTVVNPQWSLILSYTKSALSTGAIIFILKEMFFTKTDAHNSIDRSS